MEEAFLLSLGILAFGWRDTPSDSSVVYPFEWFCFTWIYISGSLDALYLLESPLGAGGSSLVASGAFTTVTIHSWRAWMLCTVYASLSFSLSSVNSNTCWAQSLLNFWRASLIAEKSAAGMQLPSFSGLSLNVVLGVLFNQLSVISKQEAVFVCLLSDISHTNVLPEGGWAHTLMLAKQAETLENVTTFLNRPALELCELLL